jgi:hypothetical protein
MTLHEEIARIGLEYRRGYAKGYADGPYPNGNLQTPSGAHTAHYKAGYEQGQIRAKSERSKF